MKDGDVLDGQYELIQCIGGGGMGSVWEARKLSTSRRVAIKALHDHLVDEKDLVARFLREAQAALESRYSGHIIEVLDVVHPPGGAPYLVMEYLEGEDLAQILEREGQFEPVRAVQLIIQACHAVAEVHRQGIIHRDVKPENLFVTRLTDGSEWIKLLDFGVAKFSASPDSNERPLTAAGSTLGTPFYMAPEQVLVSQTLDHRLDVYSMGVVLYELLTDRRPYESSDIRELMIMIARGDPPRPRELRPDLDKDLDRVVMRAMALAKDNRYESMYDLAEALEPLARPAGSRGGTVRHMESFKTVVQKALLEAPPTDPIAAAEPPTSPGLRRVLDDAQEAVRSVDAEAPTEVAIPQIDAAEVGRPSAWTELVSSWKERSPLLLVLGLGLGLTASLLSFVLVVLVFQDDEGATGARRGQPTGREAHGEVSPALEPVSPAPGEPGPAAPTSPGDPRRTDWWTPTGLVGQPPATDDPPSVVDAAVPDAATSREVLVANSRPADAGGGADEMDGGREIDWEVDVEDPGGSRRPAPTQGGKTLSRTEVRRGLQALQPRVQRCIRQSKLPGRTVRVRYKIFGDGTVAYVNSVPRMSPQVTACLRHAARGKRFRRTAAPAFNAEFPYPVR